jgi:hypothetical protein
MEECMDVQSSQETGCCRDWLTRHENLGVQSLQEDRVLSAQSWRKEDQSRIP